MVRRCFDTEHMNDNTVFVYAELVFQDGIHAASVHMTTQVERVVVVVYGVGHICKQHAYPQTCISRTCFLTRYMYTEILSFNGTYMRLVYTYAKHEL